MGTDPLRDNTGLFCFLLLARHHHIDLTAASISHKYSIHDSTLEPVMLLRIAKDFGFKSKSSHLPWKKLFYIGNVFPFMARLSDGKYVIVSGVRGSEQSGEVAIVDPSRGTLEFIFLRCADFE